MGEQNVADVATKHVGGKIAWRLPGDVGKREEGRKKRAYTESKWRDVGLSGYGSPRNDPQQAEGTELYPADASAGLSSVELCLCNGMLSNSFQHRRAVAQQFLCHFSTTTES